jgi:hypothetical protein
MRKALKLLAVAGYEVRISMVADRWLVSLYMQGRLVIARDGTPDECEAWLRGYAVSRGHAVEVVK